MWPQMRLLAGTQPSPAMGGGAASRGRVPGGGGEGDLHCRGPTRGPRVEGARMRTRAPGRLTPAPHTALCTHCASRRRAARLAQCPCREGYLAATREEAQTAAAPRSEEATRRVHVEAERGRSVEAQWLGCRGWARGWGAGV